MDESKSARAGELGESEWGMAIGFNKSPVSLLESETGVNRQDFVRLANLRVWGRDGMAPKPIPNRTFKVSGGHSYHVPHGAMIDSAVIPLVHQSGSALIRYLRSTFPEVPISWKRRRHLKLATQLQNARLKNPATAPKPIPIDDVEFTEHGAWQSISEMFEPAGGSNALLWDGVSVTMDRVRQRL